jgi:hypothetical protein
MSKKHPTYVAHCRCGAVEVGAWGAPIVVSACYCNECREAAQRLAASADLASAAGADGGTVTHFLRIVRGSLLRGQGIADAWPNLVALMLFVLGVERIGDAALSHDAGLNGGAVHHATRSVSPSCRRKACSERRPASASTSCCGGNARRG